MAGQALLPGPAELGVFVAAVFVLNATPGVDFLLTVSRTLAGGARAGIAAALGIMAGCTGHVLAAAFGLAALLAVHPRAFVLIQWAGAGYLAWLAFGMFRNAWRHGDPAAVAAPAAARRSWWADFRIGVLTNLLNPKVALFFLAFLPQFVPAASPHKTASFLLLGALSMLQGFLFLLLLVALAARLARLQPSQRARRLLHAVGGGLFLALALRVALGERPQPT
jgi:threonine/homoserine/homoserine lactone efflux protein